MIIFTSFNKKLLGKAAAIIAFSLFLIIFCVFIGSEKKEAVLSYATCDQIGQYFTEAPDTKAQQEFLKQFNIEIMPKSKKMNTITIPVKFNETYNKYNRLQEKIGLNLIPYQGQEAVRIVYRIKGEDSYVTLLIYKGHVIGGHIGSKIYGKKYKPL